MEWFSKNYQWLIGLFVQGVIAYHVFFLSFRLSKKGKLEHKEKIKLETEKLLSDIRRRKLRRKVYLVNLNRYYKDYPSNEEKLFTGYSYIHAEIKSTRFDGVQFFCEMPVQIYRKKNGQLSRKGEPEERAFLAHAVGTVPYEWIEYVDHEGDEYGWVPQFFCYFKGRIYWKLLRKFLPQGYPYRRIDYYTESEVYHEGNDPEDMKYEIITEPISKE